MKTDLIFEIHAEYLLSIKEGNVRNSCGKSTEAESIDKSKHNANDVIKCGKVDIKGFLVEDASGVKLLTGVIKCSRGKERKLLCIISIAPVEDRKDNVQEDEESSKEVGYSEEGNG